MLLFIVYNFCNRSDCIRFQYISCYCLSTATSYQLEHAFISIHLMLLFILHASIAAVISSVISIHLMLLFINRQRIPVHDVLQISIHLMLLFIHLPQVILHRITHFNTSHVTVYLDLIIHSSTQSLFQYISCYCLSADLEDIDSIYT